MAPIFSLEVTKLKRIMNFPVFTIDKEKSIVEGINLMVEHNAGSVVVTEEGRPIGIVTERDLLKHINERSFSKSGKMKTLASQPLRTLSLDDPISEGIKTMEKYRIRRLPLLNDKGHLVGIVTERDIIKATDNYIQVHSKIQWIISIIVFTVLLAFFLYLSFK